MNAAEFAVRARRHEPVVHHELGEVEGERRLAPEPEVDQDECVLVPGWNQEVAGAGIAMCGAELCRVELRQELGQCVGGLQQAISQVSAERRRDERVIPQALAVKRRQDLVFQPTMAVTTNHVTAA